jgi:hypothetical protein
MLQLYVLNVLSISDIYSKCFHLGIAKVDLNVAYVAMAMLYVSNVSLFHLFQTYVVIVSSGCCKSRSGLLYVAIATLQVYILNVLSISDVCCNGFSGCCKK